MKLFFESTNDDIKEVAVELAKSGLYAVDIADNLEHNYGVDEGTAYKVAKDAERYVRYELGYFDESLNESSDEDGTFDVESMSRAIANKLLENADYVENYDKFILDWTKYVISSFYDGVVLKDGSIYNSDGSLACTYNAFVKKIMNNMLGM